MIGLPNPYIALAGVLALASAAGGGFVYGVRFEHGRNAQAKLEALDKALADARAKQTIIDGLEATAAVREQGRQTEVREITREIPQIITRDRVVYERTCVDAAGVSLLDRARAAANGHAGEHPGAPPREPGGSSGDAAHR
jgi:hypothetical protein